MDGGRTQPTVDAFIVGFGRQRIQNTATLMPNNQRFFRVPTQERFSSRSEPFVGKGGARVKPNVGPCHFFHDRDAPIERGSPTHLVEGRVGLPLLTRSQIRGSAKVNVGGDRRTRDDIGNTEDSKKCTTHLKS